MGIIVREIDQNNLQLMNQCDGSFTVDSKLLLYAENGKIHYTVVDVHPYIKQYPSNETDFSKYLSNPDQTVFFAYLDDELVGQIGIMKHWNGYAYIDDLVVDSKHRKQGIGRALIQRAMEWTKSKGRPGIMLETQNNNVAACRFYESCVFELHGFDTHLYKGLNPTTDEIALYWYLIF
jgi:streptothricin acetyltransferase